MRWSFRRTLVLLSSILVLYIVGIFFIYIFIDFIVFSPVIHPAKARYKLDLPYQEIKLNHPNGEQVNMLAFNQQAPLKGYVLFFHGANKSADFWAAYAPFLTERGFKLFIPDYRGYGKSDGSPSEISWNEDAQLALTWLKTQASEDSIIFYGVGLGASAAAYLATINPCRIVILENPVYGLRSWMRSSFPLLMLPYELKYDFNLYEYIPNIVSPTIILQTKKSKDLNKLEQTHLQSLLPDPNNFIWLDHSDKSFPLEDEEYIRLFDQLVKSL
ncbi:MAG: alpha/beta fold hydrolase [Saprospiraceae bacterium]|nr:alpha/beta fold hydrolase [Candidatus Vicinibacter proximus]MCC6842353.1 alpha/beta fold hydrolase [Saprospiraceae bacterium]HRG33920.1 alpha/beta fold hydrolase [Saprospiraceae bacterium]